MFESSISKDMKKKQKQNNNNNKRRIPTHLLALCLTLIVKELKLVLSRVGWKQH